LRQVGLAGSGDRLAREAMLVSKLTIMARAFRHDCRTTSG
jgi:hypothetical protein